MPISALHFHIVVHKDESVVPFPLGLSNLDLDLQERLTWDYPVFSPDHLSEQWAERRAVRIVPASERQCTAD
jgi:hypothetical protein